MKRTYEDSTLGGENKGYNLLKQMGWDGAGLGKREQVTHIWEPACPWGGGVWHMYADVTAIILQTGPKKFLPKHCLTIPNKGVPYDSVRFKGEGGQPCFLKISNCPTLK